MSRLLLLAAMLVCSSAEPIDNDFPQKFLRHWETFTTRKDPALLSDFAPGAKICVQGTCGGEEQIAKFAGVLTDSLIQLPSAQFVHEKDIFVSRWHHLARVGKCEKQWSGGHIGYFDADGKIKEYHNWWDHDIAGDLRTLHKKCGGPASSDL